MGGIYPDMTDCEVYPGDWGARFEDWARFQNGRQSRFLARTLLDHLPPWLEQEIRADRLSILDWACGDGEGVDALRSHFPRNHIAGIDPSPDAILRARLQFGPQFFTPEVLRADPPVAFDVLTIAHVLPYFKAPWKVLRALGAHASRHLLVLV